VHELLPSTPKVLMWNWTVPPTASDHVCILAVLSSDEDQVARSDTAPDDHKSWVIVPNDKHITQRNLHIITAPIPSPQPEPIKTLLDFHKPFDFPQYFDILISRSMIPE
jgi:hypothetical protein